TNCVPTSFSARCEKRSKVMRKAKKNQADPVPPRREEIPPGATRRAFDREDNGGGPPGSPLGDRHAAGDPAGGAEFGGLAGSNVDDGTPVEGEPEEPDGPYAGHAGGAVGGTPAEGRASGGKIHGGLAP